MADELEQTEQARNGFRAVNPHFLESVVRLAQQTEVTASRDLVDADGTLLAERGALISRALVPALQRRCLRRPLEDSLDLAQGLTLASIVDDCQGLIDGHPALALLGRLDAAAGRLRARSLGAPLTLLLTLAARLRKSQYENGLAAMIICSGLAQGLGLSESDGELLMLSALVQDIGESYLDPALFDGRCLSAEQWPQVAAHPLVGEALLRAFADFPPALAENVRQHHERQDGGGYPGQSTAMAPLAALLGLADCVAALVMERRAAREFARASGPASVAYASLRERVAVALSIVPGEFPPAAVAFVTSALAPLEERGAGLVGGNFAQRILPTLQQIRLARQLAEVLSRTAATPALMRTGESALAAIRALDKRLRTTGVYDISQLGLLESDAQRMGQTCLVLDEVKWRLRHLARSVYLRQAAAGRDPAPVAELVAALGAPG